MTFIALWGSKAVGLAEIRFQAAVESVHGAEGDLFASREPDEDERLVLAQHAGELLHRLKTRAALPCTHCSRKLPARAAEAYSRKEWNGSLSG